MKHILVPDVLRRLGDIRTFADTGDNQNCKLATEALIRDIQNAAEKQAPGVNGVALVEGAAPADESAPVPDSTDTAAPPVPGSDG